MELNFKIQNFAYQISSLSYHKSILTKVAYVSFYHNQMSIDLPQFEVDIINLSES